MSDTSREPVPAVASPCIRVCTLDDDDICIGCGRSVVEICAWASMAAGEQQQVLAVSAARRARRKQLQESVSRCEVTQPANVIDRIKGQLAANKVLLYMKGTPDFPQCGFSAAAVQALNAAGVQFGTVNIFEDPELREALKQYSSWPTYPQLYINGELIGGADIIREMHQSGELRKALAAAQ
jgi:monothiol glutaredoxin